MAALTGALLLTASISTSERGFAKPVVSDLEFQAFSADYIHCTWQEAERLALTTRMTTGVVVDAGMAACAEKRRALVLLMTKIGKYAHADEKAIAEVSARFGASVDAGIRLRITRQIIEMRALQK